MRQCLLRLWSQGQYRITYQNSSYIYTKAQIHKCIHMKMSQLAYLKIYENVFMFHILKKPTSDSLISQSFFSPVQSLSRVQLCDPTGCGTTGFPDHHQLLEPTQTYVHRVSDAFQPSHSLQSPYPSASILSQQQGLFQ